MIAPKDTHTSTFPRVSVRYRRQSSPTGFTVGATLRVIARGGLYYYDTFLFYEDLQVFFISYFHIYFIGRPSVSLPRIFFLRESPDSGAGTVG